MLPLIPIFAGLSALGSLTGGATAVAKMVSEFNRTSPTHLGKGLYLTPHKDGNYKITSGNGLYLEPYKIKSGNGLYLGPYKGGSNKRTRNNKKN